MTFTIILLIVLTICIAALALSVQAGKERAEREAREREQAVQQHLAEVRRKYAGDQPHGYRARLHRDFTGEVQMSPAMLEVVKREIVK